MQKKATNNAPSRLEEFQRGENIYKSLVNEGLSASTEEFGRQFIHKFMVSNGLTWEQVAERVGSPRKTNLQNWVNETGQSNRPIEWKRVREFMQKYQPRRLFPDEDLESGTTETKEEKEKEKEKEKESPVRHRWTEKDRRRVFERTKGHCYLCKAALNFDNRQASLPGAWHMEHVLCISKDPAFTGLNNILPACAR